MNKEKVVIRNSISLYIMTFVKMVFPLLTLPYLTRVLSYDSYGTVNYINAVMTYIRLVIDFGFLLSATTDIARNREDKTTVGEIIGNVIVAKGVLALLAFFIMIIASTHISIMKDHMLFVLLSFIASALSIFLPDFYFQGIEQMHLLTMRYVSTQSIATVLTFVLVRGDNDLIWIPALSIIANSIAAIISMYEICINHKIKLSCSKANDIWIATKKAFIYWTSDVSSTAFTALNTVIIGIYMSTSEVALWSVALQVIIVIQRLYSPITNSIFPYMVREPNLNFIKRILKIFMPLVLLGCVLLWCLSDFVLFVLGGEKYLAAVPILHALIPLLFISFPALLFGWPVLGAIGKEKETSASTIIAAIIQVMCMVFLGVFGQFTIINIALTRIISESALLSMRLFATYKNKHLFING